MVRELRSGEHKMIIEYIIETTEITEWKRYKLATFLYLEDRSIVSARVAALKYDFFVISSRSASRRLVFATKIYALTQSFMFLADKIV